MIRVSETKTHTLSVLTFKMDSRGERSMNRKSNREGHTQKRSSYALRLRNIENCAITSEQVVAHPTNDTPIGNGVR